MASPQTHLAVDGYLDAIPTPGTSWGTAVFDLIHSPADADRIRRHPGHRVRVQDVVLNTRLIEA